MGVFLGIVFVIFILVVIVKLLKASKFSQDVRNDVELLISGYINVRKEMTRETCKYFDNEILKKRT